MTLWSLPSDRASRLALATGYPFLIPDHSFVYENGVALPWPAEIDLRDRMPVLAIGSNQSPEQLARKFDPHEAPQRIPVMRAWLADHDVVFAAHVTRYGAIPANLHVVPGMRVRLGVTWLTPDQIGAMHQTEIGAGNYHYVRLDGLELELDHPGPGGIRQLDSATAYISPFGAMVHEGQLLGLAALRAERRPHPMATVGQALDLLRRRAKDPRSLEEFVWAAMEDELTRRRLTALLRDDAVPFFHPHFTVLVR
jgi:hypothetical protein